MNNANFQLFDAIAWTIIHSLWQGAVVFVIILSLYMINKKWSSTLRFNVALTGMLTLCIATIATFMYVYDSPAAQLGNKDSAIYYFYSALNIEKDNAGIVSFINENTFLIANFWLLGFFILLLRYAVSYGRLYYSARKAPDLDLSDKGIDLHVIQQYIGISRKVVLKAYDRHVSPFTMGYLKPMIFMPISIVNALQPQEIEAIIAHELAHIKRNDYIINLFASMIEVILYYHPVIWWLQKQLDINRENACDDMAIAYIGNNIHYAKSLVRLQEEIQVHPQLAGAMAFTGNRQSIFLNRIKRMFNMPYNQINIREKLIASLVLFLLAFGITEVYAHKTNSKKLSLINNIKESLLFDERNMVTDSLPKSKKKESVTIIKSEGNKEVEVKMEDGKITYLNIDGKEIPASEYDKHKELIEDIKPMQHIELRSLEGFDRSLNGLDRNMEGFKRFDFDFGHGKGFGFHMGDLKELQKLGNAKLYFNFDSLKHKLMIDKDSVFAFWKDKSFDQDSLMKKFKDVQIYMNDDIHDYPNKSIRIYKGDGNDLFRIDEDREIRIDRGDDREIRIERDGDSEIRIDRDGDHDVIIRRDGGDDRDVLIHRDRGGHNREREIEIERFPFGGRNNLESLIGKQLNKDGFLISGKKNKVELTGKQLKINGEKQPTNIWNKYKMLFEEETGIPLSKDTKLVFEIEGQDQLRHKRSF